MGIWGKKVVSYLLELAWPGIVIRFGNQPECDLIIRGPFKSQEPYWNVTPKPYIYWSGEANPVEKSPYGTRNLALYTSSRIKNSYYYPFFLENINLLQSRKAGRFRKKTLAYCNSNPVRIREKFYNAIMRLKPDCSEVHALGKCCGNFPETRVRVNGTWESGELLQAYEGYNFVMAMENRRVPGYITEKIVNAYAAGAIPVFWGTSWVSRFFNSNSFVDLSKFLSVNRAARYILNMGKTDIEKIMSEEPVIDNEITRFYNSSEYAIRIADKIAGLFA